ncbi:hypothetical protein [Cellulomonas shaoxiangyii]|uniref:Uncharacterized protein n=1 Tax=Cellulomonas shaoxiangyii TaxID=2566013 RepID=A0A4P7SNQ0_9CELL|nr:hypothetical protein [Cellulomonas shaoxiangyii]QCB94253.1 hypothetical protein E5225_12455 [Cellulomonas shaoxiangyii]TGY78525.1 hypothetical protein E5226_16175 [Cellulomonas shaoxiangyii]
MSGPAVAPRRRRAPSRRRALALLLTSGLALVGLVTLGVVYAGIGVTTMRASVAGDEPCLVAYEDDASVRVHYTVLPPRGVCTWDVGGSREEVVVASAPTALALGAWSLALLGVAGVAGTLVAGARAAGGARPNG